MRTSGRRAKTPLGVSTFPFLAVLLCTMGSLIVLLICLVQQAQSSPVAATPPTESLASSELSESPIPDTQEVENLVDDLEFVAKQLQSKKEELLQTLKRKQDELAIAERLLREREDEAKLMQTQILAMREGGASADALEAAKEQAEQVRKEIEQLRADLEKKKKEQKDAPARLSIIPYKGKNGTTQRPIYVECLRDRVVIQPEGIEFSSADFVALKSAGNPLDASLRAVREHFARKTNESGDEAPYPLFIVRPGGDLSYLAARSAIVSWEDEYGYELVDDSVELAYPPPDEQLAEVLRRAADDARRRQEALARALPGRFRGAAAPATGRNTSSPATSRGGGLGSGTSGSQGSGLAGAAARQPGAEQGVGGNDARYLDGVADNTPRSRFADEEQASEDQSTSTGAPKRHGSRKAGDKEGEPGGQGGAPIEIERRGRNWAHAAAEPHQTTVRRSIQVRCTGTQIIFLPPPGGAGKPIAIEWAGDPVQVVDSVALQVRNRIASWGMAINNGHWQPVLDVEVTPDGERRFADLVAFFEQSGIEVRRRVQ